MLSWGQSNPHPVANVRIQTLGSSAICVDTVLISFNISPISTRPRGHEWFSFGSEGAVREVVGIGCGAFSSNIKVSFQAARSIG